MNKYGIENFIVEELYECDNEELSSYEIQYIKNIIHILRVITQPKVEMGLYYLIIT